MARSPRNTTKLSVYDSVFVSDDRNGWCGGEGWGGCANCICVRECTEAESKEKHGV